MKAPKFYRRFAAVSLIALLALAQAAAAAVPPAPQRRTTRAPQRGTGASAPATQPARPSPSPSSSTTTRQQPPPPARAEDADPPGASEIDRPFNETVGGEGYALYIEMRSLGRLAGRKEVKELLDLIRLVGTGEKEIEESLNFYTRHAEELATVNAYTLVMPTRVGLPQFIGGYEFPTAEAARKFEPQVRAMMDKFKMLADGQPSAPPPPPAPAAGAGGRRQPQTEKAPEPESPKLRVRRYGRLIVVSAEPFTLKSLRGEGEAPLAANARLQSLRGRLSSEPVFVFFDVTLTERTGVVERERMEREERERVAREAARPAPSPEERQTEEAPRQSDAEAEVVMAPSAAEPPNVIAEAVPPDEEQGEGPAPPPPPAPTGAVVVGSAQAEEEAAEQSARTAQVIFSMLLGGGGGVASMPRWPEAIGGALDIDGDSFVLRAILLNSAAAEVLPLPFLPTVISGPQITSQAASVAPAGSEVFISVSLDLPRMFNRMVGMMEESSRYEEASARREVGGNSRGGEERSAEKSLAAMEKLLGFKLREDFLPAVGNEVALSVPLRWFTGDRGYNDGYRGKGKDERGLVVLVSLNNVEGVQRMLPRVLELAGIKPLAGQSVAVSHGGYNVHQYGSLSVAYLNNFAALSWDPEAVRRFIDSMSAEGPLASDERFRAATSWSPRQKLAEAYVSRALVESLYAELTKWADPADAEVQQSIAGLQIRPESASYALTAEGGSLLTHELRLPVALVKLFASESVVGRKTAPLRQGEQSALSVMTMTRNQQEGLKSRGKTYATFEELSAPQSDTKPARPAPYMNKFEHPLSRAALDKLPYQFELRVAGDKYTLTATPREYRKTGRRSFYLDETGVIRAADRAGEPANVNDPPID